MATKGLGQHWLHERAVLKSIVAEADIQTNQTILEIGPGLGTLTSVLLQEAKNVIAVEFDPELARKLPSQFPKKRLEVIEADIIRFDLSRLPKNYKVVANVPYYITSKIIQKLLTSSNSPSLTVLLVQKEVAQRLAARPGAMSLLSLSAQLFARVRLGQVIRAEVFTPPPKVDSRVVILQRREQPLIATKNQPLFFKVVKAGFSARRKKLSSALAGGLHIDKAEAGKLLQNAAIPPFARAQDLSIEDWQKLCATI